VAARQRGIVAAVERDGRSLARDDAVGTVRLEHGPGDAFDALHGHEDRARIIRERHVELRTPLLLPCRALQTQRRIDRRWLGMDLLDPDVGNAAEQTRRDGPALGIDDGGIGRDRQMRADRRDDRIAHENIGVFEPARRGRRVHRRAADHECLGVGRHRG